jgi:hypothetical protein
MQKLLARPVAAPFLFISGIVLSQLGYGYLQRGSFQYMPRDGPTQIISPTSSPAVYWAISVGILFVGLLLLAVSGYAVLCLVRAYRAGDVQIFRGPNRLGLIMIILASILIILAILL